MAYEIILAVIFLLIPLLVLLVRKLIVFIVENSSSFSDKVKNKSNVYVSIVRNRGEEFGAVASLSDVEIYEKAYSAIRNYRKEMRKASNPYYYFVPISLVVFYIIIMVYSVAHSMFSIYIMDDYNLDAAPMHVNGLRLSMLVFVLIGFFVARMRVKKNKNRIAAKYQAQGFDINHLKIE